MAPPAPAGGAMAKALLAHAGSLPDPFGARALGLAAFSRSGLPGRRQEAWKYSDLAEKTGALAAVPAAPGEEGSEIDLPIGPFAGLGAVEIIVLDGRLIALPETLPAGLSVGSDPRADALPSFSAFPMTGLIAALAADPALLVIRVEPEPHQAIDRPVWLRFITARPGFSAARLRVEVAGGRSLTLYESHEALPGSGGAFGMNLVEMALGPGASLTRLVLQQGTSSGVEVAQSLAFLAARATFSQTQWAEGSSLSRLETAVKAEGEDVRIRIDGGYGVNAGRHADATTTVKFVAEGGTLQQNFRGVARAGGRGVFQGTIAVDKEADRTDARMRHDALLLEEGAEIFAKPELEIRADDVQCAHGNTIGALDADALFYARARGIPRDLAEQMLTEAFLADAFSGCPDAPGQARLLGAMRAWLGGGQ